MDEEGINKIPEKIIGCAYKVSNTLGSGFLEKVYENALSIELSRSGLVVKQRYPVLVYYGEDLVGDYFADMLVEDKIVVELKTIKNLDEVHMAQCMNYLKATGFEICLLINFFKPHLEIKRIILTH